MIDRLLATIAPHPCYGCSKTGSLLCDNCKYNIAYERAATCVLCEMPAVNGVCASCAVPYQRAWCVGERSGELRRLIDAYKFKNVREAGVILAELLSMSLDMLPATTRVVPVPTISAHIRQRGYDHTLLIAKELSKIRGLVVSAHLNRATTSKQRGATRSVRMLQAKSAFKISGELDVTAPHLIIDDVITTGSTVKYASLALKAAGVKDIWVAVIARQPLD